MKAHPRDTPSAQRARGLRQRVSQDAGTSLVELMVGMMLMAIFGGMFTGAIVMMNSAMNKAQAVNLTASQLNVAFTNLDNTVRYAAFISIPGQSTSLTAAPTTIATGDWYVELRYTNTGSESCTQLRVDILSQQLQRRTWNVVNAVASTPTAWIPISSGISNGGKASGPTTQPFYLVPAGANTLFQKLTINLISPSGSGSSLTNSTSTFTFTALNSVIPPPTTPICQLPSQWRP